MQARNDVIEGVGGSAAVGADVLPGQEDRFSEERFTGFLGDKVSFLNRVIHGCRSAG